ncbi:MAG: hypothetical protein NTU80_13780 [Verrucomicrobia bacterium]|nr:hypothetical protein [Verrucomicrobiota bacterium]
MKAWFPVFHFGVRLSVIVAAVLLAGGCATTEARIRRNQTEFDRLTPGQQQLIREGKIALGFTPEMVTLAAGAPDERWVRTDAKGRTEIWSYTRYASSDGVPIYTGFYHRYRGFYPGFYDENALAAARAVEYFRVEFTEGKVSVVQQQER